MIDRLLLVDPICNRRAPTIRAWLDAANEVLPRHFREVEIWSMENSLDLPGLRWRRFPKITPFWPIQCVFFRLMAWRAYRQLSAEFLSTTLVQCSGEHLPASDIRYIQFWNISFNHLAKTKPEEIPVSWKEKVFGGLAARAERQCLNNGATKEWWCVSRGISVNIREMADPNSSFLFLPNSYDPLRFNPQRRKELREGSREGYGYSEEDIVFAFASFGHFIRKGLLQAVEVVARLRDEGFPVRLLVLGGTPVARDQFKKLMGERGLDDSGISFAGLVQDAEQHLSAADALFFPSHFEAFSLVEIEAAALGLRLYLTPHPGSEMIMREGVNGRMLPWDVEGMADVLRSEITSGEIRQEHNELGEALNPAAFSHQMSALYAGAIQRKSARLSS